MTSENRSKKIFLSYSLVDKNKALEIAERLEGTGFDIVTDYKNISYGDNIFDDVKYLFQSSDFVLILLSKSLFESSNFKFEYTKEFFQQTRQRKISVIPVLIEKCNIPSDFLEYEIFNLTIDYERNLEKLLQRIKTIPEISFDSLSPRGFEEIIYDLLKAYNFKNIKREIRLNDKGVDFIAEFFSSNPFGQKKKEIWMIETKFYSESRFDIKTVKQVVDLYKYINKEDAKLLLITNSQLNSVVEDYLEDIRKQSYLDIVVVDGLLLKKLIAKKKTILNKYFLK